MKHLKYIANALVGRRAWGGNLMSGNQSFKMLLLFLGSMTTLSQQLQAQCNTLVCNATTINNPLEVSIDDDCAATLIPDVILEAEQICVGTKIITVRDLQSNLVSSGKNQIIFDGSIYVSQTLSVTITDEDSGVFCVGFIRIMDHLVPEISLCLDATTTCVGDTSAIALGRPQITDNCDQDVTVVYADQVTPYPCDSTYAGLLERTWIATDASGNENTCTQMINYERIDLSDVTFPGDITRSCENPEITPDLTGVPMLNGKVLTEGGLCNVTIRYDDATTPLCGSTEFQIVRTWTVTEECSGNSTTGVQIILMLDETAPTIVCQDTIYAQTSTGQCFATVNLPTPSISDECDANPDLVVNTSYGAVGLGPHTFVPVGQHIVQYIAVDECGNTNICSSLLIVTDKEEPTAVCNEAAIALPSSGLALVDARIFDEGSSDNCVNQLYYKVKRVNTGKCNDLNGDDNPAAGIQEWFDDAVVFCCEDVSQNNMIILRVYEVDPGRGPVDPSREAPGGDLYGHFGECQVAVTVQDRIPPVIECLHDTIVDCSEDLSDLSRFGLPNVVDNCSYQFASNVTRNLNECGIGTIERTFTAVDQSGNRSVCTQVIEVAVTNPYTVDDITWPAHFTSETCGISVDPEDLPAGFDKPVVTAEKCGRITVHHEDDLYEISYPTCYKILRKWSILDWCTYDPDRPEAGGRFDYLQIIKVVDNEAPIIDCPENIIVGIDKTCDSAIVNIPLVTATDCNKDVLITNDSPFADAGGADASGTYPLGRTTVTFTASDRCGNESTCTVTINVVDNTPPTPLCIVGLSANMADMGEMNMAIVSASAFNGGSRDNCTSQEDLKFTIRKANGTPTGPPTTDQLAFNCSETGTHLIEFWVTDQAGNSDYCETFISIQDLNNLCPPTSTIPTSAMIAGGIETESGEKVEGVKVLIHNGEPFELQTDHHGYFEMANLPLGKDYTIVPQKNGNVTNGVSTLDLVIITQHILKIKEFDSPYKIIAADVDRSGKITTLDLIQLRKVILNINTQFSNGNRSWRFVDANFQFKDPLDPYGEYFPELMNINNLDKEEVRLNFVAIKIGDVNNSAVANSQSYEVEPRSLDGPMMLSTKDHWIEEGALIEVPIRVDRNERISGYQFTFGFDPLALEFETVIPGDIPGISMDHFGFNNVNEGSLTHSWHTNRAQSLESGTTLFTVTFRAKASGSLQDLINLNSRRTTIEAYDEDQSVRSIELSFEADAQPMQDLHFEVYQNQPNPFSDRTKIPIQVTQSGPIKLDIFDASGRLIWTQTQHFDSGFNQFWVNAHDLKASGLLIYQISSHGQVVTKKMMVNH